MKVRHQPGFNRRALVSLFVVACTFGAACRNTPSSAASAAASATAVATVAPSDSSPRAGNATSEPIRTAPTATSPLSDVLHTADVEVVVSSLSDSAHPASSLVDERRDTEWRPNANDPAPWVEVSLPAEVGVQEIALRLPNGAAFGATVSHEGKEVGRLTASADSRMVWQGAELRGGLVRINLPRAPELVGLAELELRGLVPTAQLLPHLAPPAAVQSFDRLKSRLLAPLLAKAPFATLRELCAAYHLARVADSGPAHGDGTPIEASSCSLQKKLKPEGEAPANARAVHLAQVEWGKGDDLGYGIETRTLLVVQTDDGWAPSNVFINGDAGAYDTRASVYYLDRVDQAAWVHGHLQLHNLEREVVSGGYPPDGPSSEAELTVLSCRLGPHISCRNELIAYGDGDDNAQRLLLEHSKKLALRPRTWEWQREFAIAPSGRIRVGPCRSTQPGLQPGGCDPARVSR